MTLRERVMKAWEGIDPYGRDMQTGLLVPARILNLIRPDEWIGPGEPVASPWQPIDLAPKDSTLVDLWGHDCTEDQSRALMMMHPAPRRFADCLWCAPMTMSRGGFISPIEKAWYQQATVDLSPGTVTKPPKRIWPTHFMPVPGKP